MCNNNLLVCKCKSRLQSNKPRLQSNKSLVQRKISGVQNFQLLVQKYCLSVRQNLYFDYYASKIPVFRFNFSYGKFRFRANAAA